MGVSSLISLTVPELLVGAADPNAYLPLQLHGSGRMWVAPIAEMDPSAVSISAEGRDLAAEAVARRYLPEGLALPPGMVLGKASLIATMEVRT